MLATISDVFKGMISDIWNKKETIEITTNSYNDFYEFLTFLYSGNCKLNDENIFVMIDLSEFYQITELKKKCDKYLSQKEYTKENTLVFFETLSNYSLPLFEKVISKSMKENGINLVESDGFLETSKSTVEKIVRFEDRFVSEEKLFEKIYEWAENRAKNKQSELNEEDSRDVKPIEDDATAKKEKATQTFIFNMNDSIKAELIETLPFIKFNKMNTNFLIDFVVVKGFLFSYKELSEILDSAFRVKVKVTNSSGKSIIGMLSKDSGIVENIKSLKNCLSCKTSWVYWNEKQIKIPSVPSQIMKRDGTEWYLICFNGSIGAMHYSLITSQYYLLAEMIPETFGFEITENCKIEID
uniref:BTB domain-containing protein n=1 Tax=Panagrolaimus davidi TaxID=227884 RepID=A0A914P5D6_9BILA